jgi:hypothetical protein
VSDSWQPKVQLSHDVENHALVSSAFLDRSLERRLKEIRSDGWATRAESLEPLGEPLLRTSSDAGQSALYERDGSVLQVGLWNSHLSVSVACAERRGAEAIIDELRETFPLPDPSASHEVPITFWTYTPNGAHPAFRNIGVPEWADIADNYPATAREQLESIMRGFQPSRGGSSSCGTAMPAPGRLSRSARSPGSGANGASSTTSSTRTRSSGSTPTT